MITLIGCKNAECIMCTSAPLGKNVIINKIEDEIDDDIYCGLIVNAFLKTKHKEVHFAYCDGSKPREVNVIRRLKTGDHNEDPISDSVKRKQRCIRTGLDTLEGDISHADNDFKWSLCL